MNYVLTVLVALTTTCAVSAPVLAQGLPAPGAAEKVLKSGAVDALSGGGHGWHLNRSNHIPMRTRIDTM